MSDHPEPTAAPTGVEWWGATVPQSCVDMVKGFEGFSATPYQDSGGVWTIGYGSTYDSRDPLPWPRVTEHTPIVTEAEAERMLRMELGDACQEVWATNINLTENQEAALTSFVFNVGATAFRNSTLLRLLRAGDVQGAADQFLVWDHVGGRVIEGLLRRRQKERELFLTPDGV